MRHVIGDLADCPLIGSEGKIGRYCRRDEESHSEAEWAKSRRSHHEQASIAKRLERHVSGRSMPDQSDGLWMLPRLRPAAVIAATCAGFSETFCRPVHWPTERRLVPAVPPRGPDRLPPSLD